MDRAAAVHQIRAFNRFYTNIVSLLDQRVLESGYGLAEARVLYELHAHGPCGARDIMTRLTIDEGYLSRLLNQFVSKELVLKTQSPTDKRQYLLRLSASGKREFEKLESLADESIGRLIAHLPSDQVETLLAQMTQITKLLQDEASE